MTGRYATETTVTVAASKSEIERILQRYGAEQFASYWDADRAAIGFRIEGRQVKITVPLPNPAEERFYLTPTGKERSLPSRREAYDQACRQIWRALALVIKAKLEACALGISTIEREFLADVVMPDGRTVEQWTSAQIELAYNSGKMPALLMPGDA